MKTINILGKRMPIVAILMALLVVGTASAAVFNHYATLEGSIDVESPVFVVDVDVGGEGDLMFASPAIFELGNDGDIPVIVEFVTTILDGDLIEVTDLAGISLDYSVIEGTTDVEEGYVLVPPGGLTVSVDFNTEVNTVPDEYTIRVEIDPYLGDDTYDDFEGYNEMETIALLQKDGNWNPTGNEAEVSFISMGNHFYYELSSDDLGPEIEYTLIYYADKEDRFAPGQWGGNNPGAIIAIGTADGDGELSISGHINLGMNLPHPDDANAYFYDYTTEFGTAHGAKLWLVPSSNINTDFDENTRLVASWLPLPIFMENDLINYIDTDL